MTTKKRILCMLLTMAIISILHMIIACDGFELDGTGNSADNRAELNICQIGPRSDEGYIRTYPNNEIVLGVRVEPLSVTPNEIYILALLSRTGYLYDFVYLLWTDEDFAEVDPNERDIHKIRESEGRSTRLVSLVADANDKEIEPLWRDFDSFYTECREKAAEHGELQFRGLDGWNAGSFEPDESDFNRICNKYIEIKLLTCDEFRKIE